MNLATDIAPLCGFYLNPSPALRDLPFQGRTVKFVLLNQNKTTDFAFPTGSGETWPAIQPPA